jgi:cellobiose-specific phosphotransferase system component IIC
MSSLAYGALTRKREEAQPGRSTDDESPGLKTHIDALAALVPAEVLAAHAAVLSFTTETTESPNGEKTTSITDAATLRWVFVALLALSIAFYIGGHLRKSWDKWDWLRMLIPPAAFVGWTMAQKATAFDAVAPGWTSNTRYAAAIIGAIVLGGLAALLSGKADEKTPNESRTLRRGGGKAGT